MVIEPNDMSVFGRIIDPENPFMSKAAAEGVLALNFTLDDQARLKELAAKARAGTLTRREKKEVEVFARVGSMLGMLKSKARRTLAVAKTRARRGGGDE
jgi:hypothetical protein